MKHFDYEFIDDRGECHYSCGETEIESEESIVELTKNIAKAFGYTIISVTFEDWED